mmetsp:Transcript_25499/g.55828  ORF Transcript_25499/g.55828 Transcript_25499/m.55828 type:complete len:109 (+) Transcript_25499:888-1214(+)
MLIPDPPLQTHRSGRRPCRRALPASTADILLLSRGRQHVVVVVVDSLALSLSALRLSSPSQLSRARSTGAATAAVALHPSLSARRAQTAKRRQSAGSSTVKTYAHASM